MVGYYSNYNNSSPNYEIYSRSNFTLSGVTSDMRIVEIMTCLDSDDEDMVGFRFTLRNPDDGTAPYIYLPWMGYNSGNCDS